MNPGNRTFSTCLATNFDVCSIALLTEPGSENDRCNLSDPDSVRTIYSTKVFLNGIGITDDSHSATSSTYTYRCHISRCLQALLKGGVVSGYYPDLDLSQGTAGAIHK